MTQYRIIRNNKSPLGYRYFIQWKTFIGYWMNCYWANPHNEFSLIEVKKELEERIAEEKEHAERKATKNNVVVG